MKKLFKLFLLLFLTTTTFVACDDMLEVDSERIIFDDEYQMKSTNDTLYSMFGILSRLQKLSDSYVIMGELRADLMDVTPNSNRYLREINEFSVSSDNPYANNLKDYYAVINNCNYVIQNIDTSVVKSSVKVMHRTFAAVKAIRAWTYMQIMLNFGEVVYYEKPILSLDQTGNEYPVYNNMSDLAAKLIPDLEPWRSTENPNLGSLFAFNTNESYFPVRFLLGDLYLWTGEYEKAAKEYRDLMFYNEISVQRMYKSENTVVNNAFTGGSILYWLNWMDQNSTEYITNLASSNQYENMFNIDSLAYMTNYQIAPSAVSMDNWNSQKYIHSATLDTLGDLRAWGSVMPYYVTDKYNEQTKYAYISKFRLLNPTSYKNKKITIYRAALLYLRYAEAVNRLGKPNLAMVVLKYGLNSGGISRVPAHEKDSVLPSYMDFTSSIFTNNIGIHARGCGNVNLDTTYYRIPNLPAEEDSIIYVENLIEKELALETAFEGNRFHDLMRIAIRRNDNAYLADKVAAKHATNGAAIKAKLLDRANWYLKK